MLDKWRQRIHPIHCLILLCSGDEDGARARSANSDFTTAIQWEGRMCKWARDSRPKWRPTGRRGEGRRDAWVQNSTAAMPYSHICRVGVTLRRLYTLKMCLKRGTRADWSGGRRLQCLSSINSGDGSGWHIPNSRSPPLSPSALLPSVVSYPRRVHGCPARRRRAR